MEIYTKSDSNEGFFAGQLLQMDYTDTQFLTVAIASYVLDTCERTLQGETIFKNLRNIPIAEHGYFNHLVYSVHYLCAFVKTYKNHQLSKYHYGQNTVEVIANAVRKFKELKDKMRKEEIAEYGENFGSATKYVQWDPTEDLEEFLSIKEEGE